MDNYTLLSKSKIHRLWMFWPLLMIMACTAGSETTEEIKVKLSQQVILEISHKVPGDLPLGASIEDLARFAWNEFFALNWKASFNGNQNSQRGTPDQNWQFTNSGPAPELAVWETYVHRLELFNPEHNANYGYPNYAPYDTTVNSNGLNLNRFWNNLDEDNEIGSCYLFAYDSVEVLYMAKTNLVEYNYLNSIRSSYNGKVDAINNINSRSSKIKKLKEITATAFCESQEYVCFPCGQSANDEGYSEGAIEIKTAWRKLIPGKDDVTRFMTKEVVNYSPSGEGNPLIANSDIFGLIGLHIIHKTQNYPSFIYASWEQVDVRDANMKTIALSEGSAKHPIVKPGTVGPVIDRSIPPAIQLVNEDAKTLITSQNSESLWQYYQLIGVQGTPIQYENRQPGDSYLMANYVIESDTALTFFRGSFNDPFNTSVKNVVYNSEAYTMGGCQGCHGAGQFSGTDFSFIAPGLVPNAKGSLPLRIDDYQTFDQAKKAARSRNNAQLKGSKVSIESTIKLKKFLAENEE